MTTDDLKKDVLRRLLTLVLMIQGIKTDKMIRKKRYKKV